MAEDIPENPSLTAAIIAAVDQHWTDTGRAVLLSYLGKKLKDQGVWDASAVPFTLIDYVNIHIGDRLHRERRPGHEHMIGLFPKHANLTENLALYFTSPPKPQQSMFQQYVWEAFQSEIPPSHARIVNLRKGLGQDRPAPVTQLDPGEYLVDRTDQPLPSYRHDGKAMREAIEKWAAKNGLNPDELLLKPTAPTSAASSEAPPTPPRRSLLELLLGTLTAEDQKRITMPLDLVDKLRRHQV